MPDARFSMRKLTAENAENAEKSAIYGFAIANSQWSVGKHAGCSIPDAGPNHQSLIR